MSMIKWNYELAKDYVEKNGYQLISTEYHKCKDKLKMKCPNGHSIEISLNKFLQGRRCRVCQYENMSKNKTYTIEKVRSILASKDYMLLSDTYVDSYTPLKMICKNGHETYRTLQSVNNTNGCYKCKLQSNKFNSVDWSIFSNEGYKVISNTYITCYSYIDYICPNGHKGSMTYNSFQQGTRCPICSLAKRGVSMRLKYDYVKQFITNCNYSLMSKEYINSNTKLKLKCPKNHVFNMTFSKFKNGQRCPECSPKYSNAEKQISEFIKKIIPIIENDRSILKGLELDIYVPELKLAIEYCGLYWHNDEHVDRNYHRVKLDRCNSLGIRLITIFEDEWVNKPEIVKSRILQILGKTETVLYARKCELREISSKLANEFYEQNHLQGATRGKLHVGLFQGDELVQVMTIGSPSRAHTHSGLELKRLATKCNVNVVGGTSKLFKYCLSKFTLPIRTHNDLRWGKYYGNVYEKLGFTKVYESKYTPHYFKGLRRYRNQSLCKTKDEQTMNISENELRKSQGFSRIWDCGHQTWEYLTTL